MSRSPRLTELGEFGFLKKLLPRLYWPTPLKSRVLIGAGDDAGVIQIKPGRALVATTDTLVEGIHFERRWQSAHDLGWKLLAINLSDLAAMGAVTPLGALLTVSLPGDTPVDTVDNLYTGLQDCAKRWKIGFLGGDTVGSKGRWMVSATVFGEAKPSGVLTRSGARPGDRVGIIGSLGLARAGLEVLQNRSRPASWTRGLTAALRCPEPLMRAGRVLAEKKLANCLMDVSDGLEASAKLVAEASGVGMDLNLEGYHPSPALARWARQRRKSAAEYILRGGEDYALLFTAAPAKWSAIERQLPGVASIGQVGPAASGCFARYQGRRIPLKQYGYAHFKK
jgi:thiamine-monophosphate kinase